MSEHTKEPWAFTQKLSASENHRGYVLWDDHYRSIIGDVSPRDEDGKQGEANARRIVAAVNACAGIPTEVLETWAADSGVARRVGLANIALTAELTALRAQRDELAEALEVALRDIEDWCNKASQYIDEPGSVVLALGYIKGICERNKVL